MDLNCGNSIITKQMMRCEPPQGRKTEPLRILGIDGKTILEYRTSQENPLVGTMRLYDISTTSYRLTSYEAPAEQRGRYNNLVYLRGIEENLQDIPLIKRPGYHEAILGDNRG